MRYFKILGEASMVRIQVGVQIACRDGWAGTLKRLVMDSNTGQTTHLVIETASSVGEVTIPIRHVVATGYESIFLDLTSTQLGTYREDSRE
ncbi:MAG TPA: hypothetical protein G4O02_12185 [Caldilineae bacterium]|nr:hypothetical protein [Caldilineae bacterium]